MTDAQVGALWAMFFLGAVSTAVSLAYYSELSRGWRFFGFIWSAFWLTPPLITLWIRGVFG